MFSVFLSWHWKYTHLTIDQFIWTFITKRCKFQRSNTYYLWSKKKEFVSMCVFLWVCVGMCAKKEKGLVELSLFFILILILFHDQYHLKKNQFNYFASIPESFHPALPLFLQDLENLNMEIYLLVTIYWHPIDQ